MLSPRDPSQIKRYTQTKSKDKEKNKGVFLNTQPVVQQMLKGLQGEGEEEEKKKKKKESSLTIKYWLQNDQ